MAWATATFHEEHARRREHESAIAASGMLAAMKSDCHLIIVIYSIDLLAMISSICSFQATLFLMVLWRSLLLELDPWPRTVQTFSADAVFGRTLVGPGACALGFRLALKAESACAHW